MYVYMYMYRGYWERKKEALERKIKRERETGEGLHRRGVKEEEEAEESRRRERREGGYQICLDRCIVPQ